MPWELGKLAKYGMNALKMISGLRNVSVEAGGVVLGIFPTKILANEKQSICKQRFKNLLTALTY